MIRTVDDDAGSRDQEPWQAAQAARVAATIAAVANDPDPNAVGRALGYDMGGGGLVGLAGTVAGAMVDVAKVATPVIAVAAPELLPLVGTIAAVSKLTAMGARASQAGAPSIDLSGAAAAASAAMAGALPRALGVPIAVDRVYAGAGARASSSRARLEAALRAMSPARARQAVAVLMLLAQSRGGQTQFFS